MEEIEKQIATAKKSLTNIKTCLDQCHLDTPFFLDIEQSIEMLIYMSGYIECLKKYRLLEDISDCNTI